MDIEKHFFSKRHLSDNSKEDTGPNKAKEVAVTVTTMFLNKVSTMQTVEVFFSMT